MRNPRLTITPREAASGQYAAAILGSMTTGSYSQAEEAAR